MNLLPRILRNYRTELKLIVSCYLLFVCFTEISPRIGNEHTQYALVQAIVDDHSLMIDRFVTPLMEDKSFNEGHFYSDKPPGCSLLMVPQYFLLRNVLGIYGEPLTQWLVIILSMCLYSAISVAIFYHLLPLFGVRGHGVSYTFLYVFGTLCFCYSTLGVQEQFATPLVLAAFYFALRSPSRWGLALSGFFAGMSFLTRYQTLVMVIWIIPFIVLIPEKRRYLPYFLLTFALLSGALLTYNFFCFSSPFTFSSMKYFTISGKRIGVVRFRVPPLEEIKLMLISPWRGVLFFSPFLVYAIPGMWGMCKENWRRGLLLTCAALSFFGFFLFNKQWYGGSDYGFRYMTPGLPLFAIAACNMHDRLSYRKLFHFFSVVAILICTLGVVTNPFSLFYSRMNPEHGLSLLKFNLTYLFMDGTNSLINDALKSLGFWSVELSIYTTLLVFLGFYYVWIQELHGSPGDRT